MRIKNLFPRVFSKITSCYVNIGWDSEAKSINLFSNGRAKEGRVANGEKDVLGYMP